MGKNKDRKKKGSAVQKTATKAKKKTEKELKKQIEQLGEVTVEDCHLDRARWFFVSGKYRRVDYERIEQEQCN